MHRLKNNAFTLVGVGVGMISGFLYWKYVGCTSGTCPITSNPTNATIYGAVMGGLLLSMFKKENKNTK
jgi:hypothetical protein